MSKEAVVQPVKEEVKTSEVTLPVVEKHAPVASEPVPPESKKQVATAAAVAKSVTKPKEAKKAIAEKEATSPETSTKVLKKTPVAAKEKGPEEPKPEKAATVKKQVPKKPKLVRDSFTIPESDYALFEALKQRALTAGVDVKKSEVLRAALVVLAKFDDTELIKAIGLVERIKTGRPKK